MCTVKLGESYDWAVVAKAFCAKRHSKGFDFDLDWGVLFGGFVGVSARQRRCLAGIFAQFGKLAGNVGHHSVLYGLDFFTNQVPRRQF